MKIRLYKTSGKYAFSVDGFSSMHHHRLISSVKPVYDYAWEAMRDAKNVFRKSKVVVESLYMSKYAVEDLSKTQAVDPEPEDWLIDHYKKMMQDISHRVLGIEDSPEEEKEITYMLVKSHVEDLLRIQDAIDDDKINAEVNKLMNQYRKITQKYFSDYLARDKSEQDAVQDASPPQVAPESPVAPMQGGDSVGMGEMGGNLTMASRKNNILSDDEMVELMEHYGNQICSAISKHHPDAICQVFSDDCEIKVMGADSGSDLFKIHVNDRFHIDNIIPCSRISEIMASNDPKFYQRYWKPMVEAVGHFFLDDMEALIIPSKNALPDIPNKNGDFNITGWSPCETKEVSLSVSFKNDKPMWSFSKRIDKIKTAFKSGRKYTEEDFIRNQPARIKCIDPKLELYGNFGDVVQVIPINSGIGFELDVNFGRKIVRLSQDQVEIIDEI